MSKLNMVQEGSAAKFSAQTKTIHGPTLEFVRLFTNMAMRYPDTVITVNDQGGLVIHFKGRWEDRFRTQPPYVSPAEQSKPSLLQYLKGWWRA